LLPGPPRRDLVAPTRRHRRHARRYGLSVGFWATFRDFKRSTQVVLVVSLLLGLALLVGFSLTDAGVNVTLGSFDPKPDWMRQYNADWFHRHAYIPNIYAGLTGFLIGAPVAAVVLASFTVEREERAALKRVNKLSELAWVNFRDSVHKFCNDKRTIDFVRDTRRVSDIHTEILKRYQSYIALSRQRVVGNRRGGWTTEEEYEQLMNDLSRMLGQLGDAIDAVVNDISYVTFEEEWAALRIRWNTLDQYVRLQRLERNLAWFDEDIDSAITISMSRTGDPLAEFSRVLFRGDACSTDSMAAACGAVMDDVLLDRSSFNDKFLIADDAVPSGVFGHHGVEGFRRQCILAVGFLRSLLKSVENVDGAGWPGSASEPGKSS
jgi:hypothetical protein